ncbi:MAG: type I 3-dehydroquinate dehydratase [Phycisphaerales bacterium]|nr:MAG: type I 3-dehydroquinate dehydratase [Phycisphaerales bacterium]
MTYLCVPIAVADAASALDAARAAHAAGADMIEWRVDGLYDATPESARAVERLCRESPLPCILTCRAHDEGGDAPAGAPLDDDERLDLYERCIASDHPPRCIDVELATLQRTPSARARLQRALDAADPQRRPSVIVSTHDFQSRPRDLTRRLLALRDEPLAHIIKIAHRARSLRDNLELFDILRERDRPTIALAMGEFGLMSRVLAPKFGAFLTFAALAPSEATAPGQPTLHDLLRLYRFRAIDRETSVYGVVGWPVAHSISPRVHNAAFSVRGAERNAVYLPLPVPPEWEHCKATLGALLDDPHLQLQGLSVTIPHKEHLVRLARERGWTIDPDAARIGAANTLTKSPTPHPTPPSASSKSLPLSSSAASPSPTPPSGTGVPPVSSQSLSPSPPKILNTDAPAAATCLRDTLDDLREKRIAVLGAGGVARAVADALAHAGAIILIANRTHARAEQLARDLRETLPSAARADINVATLDSIPSAALHACVNCTPIGMTGGPAPDASPIDIAALARTSPGAVVFDTVYAPLDTPMLRAARAAGLPTIDGLAMFARQAALQYEAWTNEPAPEGLYDRLARE